MASFPLVPDQSFAETQHNGQKYQKTTLFHKHLSLPIGKTTAKSFFIISANFNISHTDLPKHLTKGTR